MTVSLISIVIIISAILYIALPINTIRERTSQEINEARKSGWSSFSHFSEGVRHVLDNDIEESHIQNILPLPISTNTVSNITTEQTDTNMATIHWQAPAGDEPVQQYYLSVYRDNDCTGSVLATMTAVTETAMIPLPDDATSLAVQAIYHNAIGMPTCTAMLHAQETRETTQLLPQ